VPPEPYDHLDGDRVVLLALAETTATDAERVHLGRCDVCVDDLTSTAAVVTLGRDAPRLDELPPPPPRVWLSITRSIQGTAPAPPPSPRRLLPRIAALLIAFALGAGTALLFATWAR